MQLKILSNFFLSQEVQKKPRQPKLLSHAFHKFLNAKKQKQKQHDCKEDTHRRNPARTFYQEAGFDFLKHDGICSAIGGRFILAFPHGKSLYCHLAKCWFQTYLAASTLIVWGKVLLNESRKEVDSWEWTSPLIQKWTLRCQFENVIPIFSIQPFSNCFYFLMKCFLFYKQIYNS